MGARNISLARGCVIGLVILLGAATAASAQSARTRYESALGREPDVRKLIEVTAPDAPSAARTTVQQRARRLAATYDAIVRRYPTSGYSDNALAQAGGLHQALFDRYGREEDRKAALDYYRRMIDGYPHSSLVKKTRSAMSGLSSARVARVVEAAAPAKAAPPEPPAALPVTSIAPAVTPEPTPPPAPVAVRPSPPPAPTLPRAVLTNVERTVLPEAVRVTLTFDREVTYREERIVSPARVFFDLAGVMAAPPLVDAVLDYSNDVVRQIRLGRHPDKTVRVVLDLEGVTRHSVFTLYNPYRIVIDCERPAAVRALATPASPPAQPAPPAPVERAAVSEETPLKLARETDLPPVVPAVDAVPATNRPPVPSRETADKPSPPPASPSANSAGGFSIAYTTLFRF